MRRYGERFAETGWAGTAILAAAAAVTLYLIGAPLALLLAAAFRGPQDALPFEPGTHWTFANLAAIYRDRAASITL